MVAAFTATALPFLPDRSSPQAVILKKYGQLYVVQAIVRRLLQVQWVTYKWKVALSLTNGRAGTQEEVVNHKEVIVVMVLSNGQTLVRQV